MRPMDIIGFGSHIAQVITREQAGLCDAEAYNMGRPEKRA